MAQDCHINFSLLDKISNKHPMKWLLFSEAEFVSFINKYNNSLTSGSGRLSWRYLRLIIKNSVCLKKIINIADVCFKLGYWTSYFKISTSIIISKLNKKLYNSPKAFRPIILFNTLEKLIEKVISEQLKFHSISNNFIHLSQLGGLKQCLLSDARVALIHFICTGWIKNNTTSTLAFVIA